MKSKAILICALLLVLSLCLAGCAKESVEITLDFNGGQSESTSVSAFKGGKIFAVPSPENGKKFFIGWYTEKEGGEKWNFVLDTVKGGMTLYARWGDEGYLVSFDNNLSAVPSPVIGSQLLAENARVSEPLSPTVDDGIFLFKGWYKEKECNNVFDFGAETVSQNITLYGKWVDTFRVFFNFNSPDIKNLDTRSENGGRVTPPSSTRAGYLLANWCIDKDKTIIYENQKITADTVLYANWLVETDSSKFDFEQRNYSGKDIFSYTATLKEDAVVGETLVLPAKYKDKPVVNFSIDDSNLDIKNIYVASNIEEVRFGSAKNLEKCFANYGNSRFFGADGVLFIKEGKRWIGSIIPAKYFSEIKLPEGYTAFDSMAYGSRNHVLLIDYAAPDSVGWYSSGYIALVSDQYYRDWVGKVYDASNIYKKSENIDGLIIRDNVLMYCTQNVETITIPSMIAGMRIGCLPSTITTVYFEGACPDLYSKSGDVLSFGNDGGYSDNFYIYTPTGNPVTKYFAKNTNLESFDSWLHFDNDKYNDNIPGEKAVKLWEEV